MKILGNKLIVKRNVGDTLRFKLQYENGDPFVISNRWDNPHFIMTITSSRYTQEERYIKTWWLNLTSSDIIKLEQTDIYHDIDAIGGIPSLPVGDGWAYKQVVKTYGVTNYHYWYSNGGTWVPYNAPVVNITFTVQDASEWIEQNYRWDCAIVTGSFSNSMTEIGLINIKQGDNLRGATFTFDTSKLYVPSVDEPNQIVFSTGGVLTAGVDNYKILTPATGGSGITFYNSTSGWLMPSFTYYDKDLIVFSTSGRDNNFFRATSVLLKNQPPLRDFIVVKNLVDNAMMEVSSDSLGGLK